MLYILLRFLHVLSSFSFVIHYNYFYSERHPYHRSHRGGVVLWRPQARRVSRVSDAGVSGLRRGASLPG